MATSEIQLKTDAKASFTITLASLATNSARQSTLLTNTSKRQGALIGITVRSGAAAPVAGETIDLYLLRSDGTTADDNAGATDAAITLENAEPLGSIVVTASANKVYYKVFDTSALGPLGPTWGIAVFNRTSQTLSATAGDFKADYTYYLPEAQ